MQRLGIAVRRDIASVNSRAMSIMQREVTVADAVTLPPNSSVEVTVRRPVLDLDENPEMWFKPNKGLASQGVSIPEGPLGMPH